MPPTTLESRLPVSSTWDVNTPMTGREYEVGDSCWEYIRGRLCDVSEMGPEINEEVRRAKVGDTVALSF